MKPYMPTAIVLSLLVTGLMSQTNTRLVSATDGLKEPVPISADDSIIQRLVDEMATLRAELNQVKSTHKAEISELREELDQVKLTNKAEISVLREELDQVKLTHKAEIYNVREELNEVEFSHKAEISALRDELDEVRSTHRTEISAMTAQMDSMSRMHEHELFTMSKKWETKMASAKGEGCEMRNQVVLLEDQVNSINRDLDLLTMNVNIHEMNEKKIVSRTYDDLSHSIQEQKSGVVAFLARRGAFTGSPSQFTPIPFDNVLLNIGDAYDPAVGEFTAPVAGIYSISYEALAGTSCGSGSVCVTLFVNSTLTSESCDISPNSVGTAVTVQMAAGDAAWVSVNNYGNCEILESNVAYNKFSGHLLYQII